MKLMKNDLNSKLRILELVNFFTKYTDESTQFGINELITEFTEYMSKKYNENFQVSSDTLLSDIKVLNKYGFEVIINKDKYGKNFYSHQDKLLDNHELNLIMNAIASFKFLNDSETRNIKNKITKLVPKAEEMKIDSYMRVNKKLKVKDFKVKYSLYNVNKAINFGKMINFKYKQYYIKGGKIYTKLKHNGKVYIAEPYGITLSYNKCYLIAKDIEEDKIKHFRVELMEEVEIEENSKIKSNKFDLEDHLDKCFNMHGGDEVKRVRLKFNKKIINNVVDYFGQGIAAKELNETYFEVEKDLYINQGLISWIIQYGENIEVVEPIELIDGVKERIKSIYNIYYKNL